MQPTPVNTPLAMSGNVQGFELPRGCLMTSGVIAFAIITFTLGLAHADSLRDIAFAVAGSIMIVGAYALVQRVAPVGRARP